MPKALIGRYVNNQSCDLAITKLLKEIVVYYHFSEATCGKASQEAYAPYIRLVNLKAHAFGQEHAYWRDYLKHSAFFFFAFDDDHSKADLGRFLGY